MLEHEEGEQLVLFEKLAQAGKKSVCWFPVMIHFLGTRNSTVRRHYHANID